MKAFFEKLLAGAQYILPQHTLSRMVYALMRCEAVVVKNFLIRAISRLAGIDRSEALSGRLEDYPSFNAWFTRELKPGVRVFEAAPDAVQCPCDGTVSEIGQLQQGRILQAKNRYYTLGELMAGDPVGKQFEDGFFATIYLSPKDYHRVHMPLAGTLEHMIYVPGRLFSVAPYTVRRVPGLFARNERVICVFETGAGPMAVILVGAMLVSSVSTAWAGEVTGRRTGKIVATDYTGQAIHLDRGAELGRFNMGSTVIVLLPPGSVEPLPGLAGGDTVRVGQLLARLRE